MGDPVPHLKAELDNVGVVFFGDVYCPSCMGIVS